MAEPYSAQKIAESAGFPVVPVAIPIFRQIMLENGGCTCSYNQFSHTGYLDIYLHFISIVFYLSQLVLHSFILLKLS